MSTPHCCPVCQGHKQVRNPNLYGHTAAPWIIPCPACAGTGLVWEHGSIGPRPPATVEEVLNHIAEEAWRRARDDARQAPDPAAHDTAPKTLNVTSSKDSPAKVSDVEVFGDPDRWRLICKASSNSQGWMKSTKVMELPSVGLVLQVSTQQGDHVAEALCFVPYGPTGDLMRFLGLSVEAAKPSKE